MSTKSEEEMALKEGLRSIAMPKPKYKTRRGLALRAPSPFESVRNDRKVIAEIEIKRREKLFRKIPSHATRLRYHLARTRLGLSPNSTGSIDWSRLHKRTTFIWKHPGLEETARWMIEQTFAAYAKHPSVDRAQIALHFANRAFGIMPADILGDQRSPVLVLPRDLVMVCLKRSGISRNESARRLNRDHTCLPRAIAKVGHFFESKPNEQSVSDIGPASDGQPEGSVSA